MSLWRIMLRIRMRTGRKNREKEYGQIMEQQDCVYVLLCGDGTLYTGWTNNLPKRLADHQAGEGAKYTRSRLPVQLVYYELFASKQEAMKREYALKRLSRAEKVKLIERGLVNKQELCPCGFETKQLQEAFLIFKEKAAWQKALQLLSCRDYSSGTLEAKLCQSFDKEAAAKAVAKMTEMGYLNDLEYGRRLAQYLQQRKGYSYQRIRQELYKHKIAGSLIANILEDYDEESEISAIIAFLEKKHHNKLMDKKDLEKTTAGLLRRGFRLSHIRRALQQVNQQADQGDGFEELTEDFYEV